MSGTRVTQAVFKGIKIAEIRGIFEKEENDEYSLTDDFVDTMSDRMARALRKDLPAEQIFTESIVSSILKFAGPEATDKELGYIYKAVSAIFELDKEAKESWIKDIKRSRGTPA